MRGTKKKQEHAFIVGDRVVISEAGHALYGNGMSNPVDTGGTITTIDTKKGWIVVKWDNGEINAYQLPRHLSPLQGESTDYQLKRAIQERDEAISKLKAIRRILRK